MRIQKLPQNCSAYYMSELSEFDDFKQATADLIKRDAALGAAGKRISAIVATTLKMNKRTMDGLISAGFKVVGEYVSHNHGNRVVVLLFRIVKRKEFDTGVAMFPRRKNRKER